LPNEGCASACPVITTKAVAVARVAKRWWFKKLKYVDMEISPLMKLMPVENEDESWSE
jgi:hypothetical protein